MLSRARRDRSGPGVASRFLLRLQAMAGTNLRQDDRALALAAMIAIVITGWFIDNPFGHDSRAYFSVACMGLLFNPMGRIAHTSAPRFAPAAEIALFMPVETLAATAWAWIAFNEKPVTATFIGGGIVIFGMMVGTLGRASAPSDPGRETVSYDEVTLGTGPA